MAHENRSIALVARCLRALGAAFAFDRIWVMAFCAAGLLSACVGGPQPEPPDNPGGKPSKGDAGAGIDNGSAGMNGEAGSGGAGIVGGSPDSSTFEPLDGGRGESDASLVLDAGLDASCSPSPDTGMLDDAGCEVLDDDSGALSR